MATNTQDKSAGKRKSAFGFTAARGPSPEFSDSTALARDESGYLDGARVCRGSEDEAVREGGRDDLRKDKPSRR